jgi:hypothetical protein
LKRLFLKVKTPLAARAHLEFTLRSYGGFELFIAF